MRIVVAAFAIFSPSPAFRVRPPRRAMRRSDTTRQGQVRQPASSAANPSASSDYVVRDSNQLPVGSSIWWDQMLREGRAGTCCN